MGVPAPKDVLVAAEEEATAERRVVASRCGANAAAVAPQMTDDIVTDDVEKSGGYERGRLEDAASAPKK